MPEAGQLSVPFKLARDSGEPGFAEPWQAQVFALAVTLFGKRCFTWNEWTEALGREIKLGAARGEADDGSHYFEYCLASLETLVISKGLCDQAELLNRKLAWVDAYRRTSHGRPVELNTKAPEFDAQ